MRLSSRFQTPALALSLTGLLGLFGPALAAAAERPNVLLIVSDDLRGTLWSDEAVEPYDEQTDPEETRNLAGNEQHAETVKELTALLRALPKPKLEKPK